MKKLYALLLAILLACWPGKRAQASISIPYLVELIAQGSQALNVSIEALNTISDMREEVMKVVKVVKDIADAYQTSQEMMNLADKTVQIYTTYTETILLIGQNELFLTKEQTRVLIYTMDAAAFNLSADDTNRSKGMNKVAGGALEVLPTLIKWLGSGGQSANIRDFVDLMEMTQKKVNSSLRRTQAGQRYCKSVIRKAKINAGIYDIDKAVKDFKRRHNI